jgi:hypothetical protein
MNGTTGIKEKEKRNLSEIKGPQKFPQSRKIVQQGSTEEMSSLGRSETPEKTRNSDNKRKSLEADMNPNELPPTSLIKSTWKIEEANKKLEYPKELKEFSGDELEEDEYSEKDGDPEIRTEQLKVINFIFCTSLNCAVRNREIKKRRGENSPGRRTCKEERFHFFEISTHDFVVLGKEEVRLQKENLKREKEELKKKIKQAKHEEKRYHQFKKKKNEKQLISGRIKGREE